MHRDLTTLLQIKGGGQAGHGFGELEAIGRGLS